MNPEFDSFWAVVGQVTPVLAIGLVIEIRQAVSLWTLEAKAKRLVESSLFALIGFVLVLLFGAALSHLDGDKSWFNETATTWLLLGVLFILAFQPVQLAFVRVNQDIVAKPIQRTLEPVLRFAYLRRSRKIKRIRSKIEEVRSRSLKVIEKANRSISSTEKVIANVHSSTSSADGVPLEYLLKMLRDYETYEDDEQQAFNRLVRRIEDSADRQLVLRVLLKVRADEIRIRSLGTGMIQRCDENEESLKALFAHPFAWSGSDFDFEREMTLVGHDYLFLFPAHLETPGSRATPA